MSTAACPNCLTPLESSPEVGAADALCCPVCHHTQRACPSCGAVMLKQVQAPDEVRIEAAGLPLDLCDVKWVCQSPSCGASLDATL